MRDKPSFWRSFRRLLAYGRAYQTQLGIAIILLWVAAAAEVSGPILISYFIDHVVAKGEFPTLLVTGLVGTYLILEIITAVLSYYQSLLFNHSAIGVVQQLRTDVMNATLRQPLQAFDNRPIGQLISRVTNDTEAIKDLYVTVVSTALKSFALISTMLIAMFILSWRMALIATALFPAVFVLMLVYQRLSTPIVRRMRAYLADINDGFNEVISGMSVIQQFRQQKRFGHRLSQASQEHYLARMKILRLDGFLLRPLLSLLSALILCGLLLQFGLGQADAAKVGVLYAFISYLGRLNEPLIALATQQSLLQQAVVAGERIFDLMDSPQQQYGEENTPLQSGDVSVQKVSFAYQSGESVLHDISLHAPSGSFVALVGHTGSGKSTLASLLMGYYPVTQGCIRLDGHLLSDLSHQALRQGIALVQQDPMILADNVRQNITLGRNFSDDEIWHVLKLVQLEWVIRALPGELDAPLKEQGNNLSAGQKQLLSLARVLIDIPPIVILDEATANIDSGTEQAIQQILHLVRQKSTLIVIAHRLSTIVDADQILLLHQGRLVEQGKHHELLASHGRYYQMYQLHQAESRLQETVEAI